MRWVQAIERDDPDPVGGNVPVGERGHAFDVDAGSAPHAILGEYTVKADSAWSDPLPWERCEQCVKLVGRYPVNSDGVIQP
jgi:hypothetical protein